MTADRDALWAVIEARDETIARYEAAYPGLLEKQRVLEDLATEAKERERIIDELKAATTEREKLIEELHVEGKRREQSMKELQVALDEARAVKKLNSSLIEKEAVIAEQAKALAAYRATFAVVGIFVVPLNHFVLGMKSVWRRTLGRLGPKLGILYQHPPQPLRVTAPAAQVPQPAPRISIVTPSFGQARFIERTLKSVIDQGYPNLEYFVQDGGSKDGTVEILERYAARVTGWASVPDNGQSQAINRAFARTTGEIMAWLNSDDVLFPGALACVADFFARHPDVDVVYGHRVLINEHDHEIGRWILPAHEDHVLSWADFVPQETLFWRRSLWEKIGGSIDESFRFAMDWDLLLRFRDAGARFRRIPAFLGGFRVHAQQKTTAGISDIGFAEMDRLRERALGRVPTHFEINKAVARYMLRHTAADLGWRLRSTLGMQA
jgi:carbamoyltransferase